MISWLWVRTTVVLGEASGNVVMAMCAANGREKKKKKDR